MNDQKWHRCVSAKENGTINVCRENVGGKFWVVGSDDCMYQVNFCPYCGARAPVPIAPVTKHEPIDDLVARFFKEHSWTLVKALDATPASYVKTFEIWRRTDERNTS